MAPPISRRDLLLGALGVAAGGGLIAAGGRVRPAGINPRPDPQPAKDAPTMTASRMPTAFVPHGGGPWPVLPLPMGSPDETTALANYMRSIAEVPATTPKALLVVSAHWEEPVATVNTAAAPSMLYDYGGFPPEAYTLEWKAPGDPELATQVKDLLRTAGHDVATNDHRGYDHGTFIPLMLAWPEANIPTVQLSLVRGLDPAEHLALGEALASLRDQGVFIIGSGNSYHNLRAFFDGNPRHAQASLAYDAWLNEAVTLPVAERNARLAHWSEGPDARLCHPREEHLIPLMVCAGAAGGDAGSIGWSGDMMGKRISAHHFGV